MIEFIQRAAGYLMGRRGGGAGTPTIDVQRLARAIAGPGIDTRTWVTAGTVGVKDDRGRFVTNDPEAVYVDNFGAVASVQVEPDGQMVTARWNGVACGRFGFFLFPLRAGDEVTVLIPDGDYNSDAISIVDVHSNQTAQIPTDWNNDRVLLSLNVPLEIEGPAIRIRSPNLDLNRRKVTFSSEGI
jgi:hypothetical protein